VKVALVHDWLTGMRGGEKVLEQLCVLFPDAEIFTLVHLPGTASAVIERHRIHTSFVQGLPGVARHYRNYLPLFPAAVRQFDLRGFDFVLSCSHCAVKSVIAPPGVRHLCYCLTPMRYAWDQFDAYFGPERVGAAASLALRPAMAALAAWDRATAHRPSRYLAISQYVARRIGLYYNRRSDIVYPPVDTTYYQPGPSPAGDEFLIVSALVPYKRVDLAIAAARRAGVRLAIVGDGPERARLEALAAGAPGVRFLGRLPDDGVREHYRRAAAVLLPGEEDFGIVPVEAQACGRPVVALGKGGACETVVDGQTGLLVADGSEEALAAALRRAAATRWEPARIRAHAERFGHDRFRREMHAAVEETLAAPASRVW
jgi:glycosyltransferase involved in cell wall biosynthesis